LDYVKHAEIPQILKGLSVLVLPSLTAQNWREQFGRVIIEALASEVPVVGSDSGEIPFLIEKLGGGLVTREGEPRELADALDRLNRDSDLRRRLGLTGKRNVLKFFLEEEIAKQLAGAFALISQEQNGKFATASGQT